MRRIVQRWVALGAVLLMACEPGAEAPPELVAGLDMAVVTDLFEPIPPSPPDLPGNPLTEEKVELGRMLFFEPRLSASWLISCNTCHNVGLGGVDLLETSVGHGWQRGPRNSPTVFNAVFNIAQFWDGRAQDLAEQAKGPIQDAVEMNSTPERVVATLRSIPQYVSAFEAAFPGEAEAVTFDNMALAIEAFEATLITPGARFDQFLEGDRGALTHQEQEGLVLFIRTGCASCHNGINLGGQSYHPFGVVERPAAEILPPGDRGRYEVTRTAADQYVFKAPTLRNIELTPPFFHSGRVWELEEAVVIMGLAQLGRELARDEARLIHGFLRTLTGRQPVVEYPILPPHTAETPLPDVSVVQRDPVASD
jgi:cytochrome c peroxidase